MIYKYFVATQLPTQVIFPPYEIAWRK